MRSLHLGLSLTGSTAAAFTPASILTGGAKGAWYSPSDTANEFQDAGGTTPAAVSSPIGKMLDKSGNANHISAATTGQRPTLVLDGSNYALQCIEANTSGLQTPGTTGSSFTATMDVYIALKNNADTTWASLCATNSGTLYVGLASSGDATANNSGSGTPSVLVDGVAVSPNTRAGLYTAIGSGSAHVMEYQNVDMSAWTGIKLMAYVGFAFNGYVYEAVVVPAQSSANRAKLRTYVGAKAGLTI